MYKNNKGLSMKKTTKMTILLLSFFLFFNCNNKKVNNEVLPSNSSDELYNRAMELPLNEPVILTDPNFKGIFATVWGNNQYLDIYIFDGTNKCKTYSGEIPFNKPNDIKPSFYQFDIIGDEINRIPWEDRPGTLAVLTGIEVDSSYQGTYFFNEDGSRLTIKWNKQGALGGRTALLHVKFPDDIIPNIVTDKTIQNIWSECKNIIDKEEKN